MMSSFSGESDVREALIRDDLVDCVVALPGQLFYSTQIPVCLWFLTRKKQNRNGKTLFIDARKMGKLTDRVHRDLSGDDIAQIANTYHAWKDGNKYNSLWGGQVALDNGEIAVREYIRHPGGVAIVSVIDGNIILIEQFRISIERKLIELPAGRLEPNEEPMSCAARELEEEIGYRAERLIPLASYFSSVGYSNERMHLFLALDLEKTKIHLEADERIREILMPVEMVKEKLANQEFEDSKTIIDLREALVYLEREGNQ